LASNLSSSCSDVLLHPLQAQLAPQNLLLAKHSQYNFMHFDLLQLHDLVEISTVAVVYLVTSLLLAVEFSTSSIFID
jgi:hypothetical protein